MSPRSFEKNPKKTISFSNQFIKDLRTAPKQVVTSFYEQLEFYINSPTHPSLRIHQLREGYARYSSMDVTEDWRALFTVDQSPTEFHTAFHRLGTHQQLYRHG